MFIKNGAKFPYNFHYHDLLLNKKGHLIDMKNTYTTIGLFGLSIALASIAPSTFAQNFYKWVDAKGSTHYTATPPPSSAKKKSKVETYGWKTTPAAKANNASENEQVVTPQTAPATNTSNNNQQNQPTPTPHLGQSTPPATATGNAR